MGQSGQWLVRGCSSHQWVGEPAAAANNNVSSPKIHPDYSVIRWEAGSRWWIGGKDQQSSNASCWMYFNMEVWDVTYKFSPTICMSTTVVIQTDCCDTAVILIALFLLTFLDYKRDAKKERFYFDCSFELFSLNPNIPKILRFVNMMNLAPTMNSQRHSTLT